MGRKKSFADKSNSVTYSLIHSSAPAGEQPQRLWVEKSRGSRAGRPDPTLAAGTEPSETDRVPLALRLAGLFDETEADLTEAQRREIVNLGLPDDGYDYLQHLRDPHSASTAPSEGQAGQPLREGAAVFVPAQRVKPPDDDTKIFQSFRLHLAGLANNEAEAASGLSGVTAFSREVSHLWNKNEEELAELRRAMLHAEAQDDLVDEDDAILDDFLLSATQGEVDTQGHKTSPQTRESPADAAGPAGSSTPADRHDAWDSDTSDADSCKSSASAAGDVPFGNTSRSRCPASIASTTYWRPERGDRKAALSVIDDRFEQLALGYNSDEMGELDEDADGTLQGSHALEEYDSLMSDFLAEHATQDHAHEGGLRYDMRRQHGLGTDPGEAEAAIAVAKAREHLRAAEQRESRAAEPADHWVDEAPERERWDCDTVLTTLSNLDNHPGTILEPTLSRHQRKGLQQKIQLSAKTGLPIRPSGQQAEAREAKGQGQEQGQERGQGEGSQKPLPQHHRGETTEQRRARKASVKEARRKARASKKELKVLFKEEGQRHCQPGVAVSTIPLS